REYDTRRRRAKPWRAWYGTATWRAIRDAQLAAEPLCRMCADEGRVTEATVCDHVEPHRGDWQRFVGGPFQSLCATHHSKHKQRIEAAAPQGAPRPD
ncbi:MAG: HNH endonuclease, partial [Gammaproteobacteria bacterium]|nr:HNH endonuclease [Gammaproteobacteria bacterium]